MTKRGYRDQEGNIIEQPYIINAVFPKPYLHGLFCNQQCKKYVTKELIISNMLVSELELKTKSQWKGETVQLTIFHRRSNLKLLGPFSVMLCLTA
jgi:hypothetical protein